MLLFAPAALVAQAPTGPIQDNSFLVEEAYNQERGVVQHISVFDRDWRGGGWLYAFTQEWPLGGQRHQLSYGLLLEHVGAPGATTGIGDIALNYRYQLVGSGDTRLAVAPRLTVLLPTGSSSKGLGAGGMGVQASLPASILLTPKLITHWNAGATVVPSARNAIGDRARTTSFNLGQSVIFLATNTINVMLETVWTRNAEVTSPGATASSSSLLVCPGMRFAINMKSGLQIVPGFAVPLGVGPSAGENALLLYLSFEHPFKR